MSKLIELFRVSPFEPLREHLAKVMECVGYLKPMLEAARDGDYAKLDQLTKEVFRVEHEAEIIKDEIRQTIPKTFFLPVFRGDLLGYLKLQDDMADAVEDVAVVLMLKKLTLPSALHEGLFTYADKVLWVCDKTLEVSDYIQKVVDSGFHADEVTRVGDLVSTVEKAEWESDRMEFELSKSMFAIEDQMKPTDIFLWSKVFEEMGDVANAAEKAADRIRRMLTVH